MADARLPTLGRRQRLAMWMMTDRGWWAPGVPWGVGADSDTRRCVESLQARGMLAFDPHRERWVLAGPGYAWLIIDAALDLRQVSFASDGWQLVTEKLARLTAQARRHAVAGPVDWRGDTV